MNTAVSFIPVVLLFITLGILKKPAYKVVPLTLLITLLLAFIFFNSPAILMLNASLEGTLTAFFPILYVIILAVYTYNLGLKLGSIEVIKRQLMSLSRDGRVQVLIIALGFGGFLEAIAGFGTAVAIPASILISLGFDPFSSAILCLVANSVPVAFGALGLPIITLSNLTEVPTSILSQYAGWQLLLLCVLVPPLLVVLTAGFKGLKGIFWLSVLTGLVFGLGQTLVAVFLGHELAAITGSVGAVVFIIVYLRLFPIKEPFIVKEIPDEENPPPQSFPSLKESLLAWSPYLLILLFILVSRYPCIYKFLSSPPFALVLNLNRKDMKFDFITTPGTLLLMSAVVSGLIQRAPLPLLLNTLKETLNQLKTSILTIVSIVALAKVMGYSGMVMRIAEFIAGMGAGCYPFFAPFIGSLGTFLTGSDAASNILFGELQKSVAQKLQLNIPWILASNTTGASAGKMISPQSLAIATATTGISGKEGDIFSRTIVYCILYLIVLGIIVFVFQGIGLWE